MIELTDLTLNLMKGDYKDVCALMLTEVAGEWMLISEAFVTTEFINSNFRLHFWKNGDVFIYDTDHPMQVDSSDEDFRHLSQWCKDNGWTGLKVDERLLGHGNVLEFWKRMFIAGLVGSDTLQKNEEEEMERIMKTHLIEKDEDDAFDQEI